MSGGEFLRLTEVCQKRGLRLGLGVGPLNEGAREFKRLKVRDADNGLLVSVEIGRSLDKASREALDVLRSQRF